LVRRYEPVARAAAIAILHDTHLAQDVLQETFLRVYTNLGKLTDRSRFGPWVLKIARREALRTLRRRHYVKAAREPDDLEAESHRGLDEDSRELLDAVGRLPDHEQVAVVLHYFEAHKVETIAEMTGRTTGTVTKQLSRARRRLERWLRRTDE
jgi:RNA polymerase sigma-70 factor (ECF subfamily)